MFRSKPLLRFAQTVVNTQLRRKSNSNSLFTEITSRKRCNSVGTQSLDNVRDKINEKIVTRIKSEVSTCINNNKNGLGKLTKSHCTTKNGEEKPAKFFRSASASCSNINDNRKPNFGAPLLSLNDIISVHRSEKMCRKLTDYTNDIAEVLKFNKESIILSKNIKSLPNIIVSSKKLKSNSKIDGEFNRNNGCYDNCYKLNEKKINSLNYNILPTPNIFNTVKQKLDIRIPADYSFDRVKNIKESKFKSLKSFNYNFDNYTITKDSLGMFNHNYKNTNISKYSKKKANTLFKSVKESFKQKELRESHTYKLLKNRNLKGLWIKPKQRAKINNKLSLIFNEIQGKNSIQNKITDKKQNNMLKCNDFSKINGRLETVVRPSKSRFDELYFWHNNDIILKQSNEFLYKRDKNIFMNYQTRSLKTSAFSFNCANKTVKSPKPHESVEKEINGNQTCNIGKQGNYKVTRTNTMKLNNILSGKNHVLPSSKINYLTKNLSDDVKCEYNYTKKAQEKHQQKNFLNSIYKKSSKSIYDGFTKVMMDKVHLWMKSFKNKDCKQSSIYGCKNNYFTPRMTLVSKDQNRLDYHPNNDEKKGIRNLNERKPVSNDFKKNYQSDQSLLEITSSKKINSKDSQQETKLSRSKINELKLNKLAAKKDQKSNKVELRKSAVVRVQVKGYEVPKSHPSLKIANKIHDYDYNKKALVNKSVIPNVMIRTDSVKTIHSLAPHNKRKTYTTECVKNKHHKSHNTLSCLSNDNEIIENYENKDQIQEDNNKKISIDTELIELSTKKATDKIMKNKVDTAVAWEHDKIYEKDKNIPFNFRGEFITKQLPSCDDKANLNLIQNISHKTIKNIQQVKRNLIKSNSAVPWIRNKDDAISDGINLKSQSINNFTDNDKAIAWVQNSIDYIINSNLMITNNVVQNSQIKQCIKSSAVQSDSHVQKKEEKLVNIGTASENKNIDSNKKITTESLIKNSGEDFREKQETILSKETSIPEAHKNENVSLNPDNYEKEQMRCRNNESSEDKIASENMKNKKINPTNNGQTYVAWEQTNYSKENKNKVNDGLNYKFMNDQLHLSNNQNKDVSMNERCSSFDTLKQRELNVKCKVERVNENLNSPNKVTENEFEKCDRQNIDMLSKKNETLLDSVKTELKILPKDCSLISKETKINKNYLCKSNDQVDEEIDNNTEKPLFSPFIQVPPQEGVNKHTITHYYKNKINPSLMQFIKGKQDYKTAEELTELLKFKPWNENADVQTSDGQLLNDNKLKEKHESVINNEAVNYTEGLNSVTTVSKVTDVQLSNKVNMINNNSMKNTKIARRSFSDKQNYTSTSQNESKKTEAKGIFNEMPLHHSDLFVNINKSSCQENDKVKSQQKLSTSQLLNKEETDDNKQFENNDKRKLQPLPDDNYKGFNEVHNKTHRQMKRMYEYEEKAVGCNHNRNEQLDHKKNNINKKEPKFSDYDTMDTKTHAERMAELYEYEATILGIYDHEADHPAKDHGNIINSTTFNTLQNSFKPIIVPSGYERKNKRLQRNNRKKHLPIIDLSNQTEETVKKQTKFEDCNHNINFNYKEHKTEWVESKDLVTTYLHLFQGNEVMECSIPTSLSEPGQLTKSQDYKTKVNGTETINITVEVPLSNETKTDNMFEQSTNTDAQIHMDSSTLNKKVEVSVEEIKCMKYPALNSEDDLVFANQKLDKETENSKNYILKSQNNNRYIITNKADKKLENTTKENESLEDEKTELVLRNVYEETESEIDKENFQQSSTRLLSESGGGGISNRTVIKRKSFSEESERLESKEEVDTEIQTDELMILQNILSNDSELLGNDSFTVCFPKKQLSAELLKVSNKEPLKLINNKNNMTHTVVKTVLNAIAYTVQKNQKTCKLTDKDVINNKRLRNDLSFSLESSSTDNTLDNKLKTNNESHSNNVKDEHIMMINEVKFPMINAEKSAMPYPKETEITLNKNIKNKCAYKHIPSVSKILNETLPLSMKDALDKWNCTNKTYLSTPQEIEEYYKEQLLNDLEFHDCIRRHILKTPLNLLTEQDNPRLKGSLKSLKDVFPRISNVKALESPVIHPELPYYGMIDCIACYDGNPVLIEWKQSDQPKSILDLTYDAPVQLSAYIGAINHDQNYDLPITSGLIIVAHTDGSPADVLHLANHECKKYWKNWLERIEKYIDSKIKS